MNYANSRIWLLGALVCAIVSSAVSYLVLSSVAVKQMSYAAGPTDKAMNISSPTSSFHASGRIASTLSPLLYPRFSGGNLSGAATAENFGSPAPPPAPNTTYSLVGNWSLTVADGQVAFFAADFDMVRLNGTDPHSHSISNLQSESLSTPNGLTYAQLDQNGNTEIFGNANVYTDGSVQWHKVPIDISILHGAVVSIRVDQQTTANHFGGLPIFGVVNYLSDSQGRPLASTPLTVGK